MAETDTVVARLRGVLSLSLIDDMQAIVDEAADLIARLQAENEALRRERDEARGNYDGLLTTWAESRERHLAAEAKMLDLQGALRDVLPYAVTCIGLPRPCWPTDSVILRAEALLKGAPHG